VKRIGFIGFGEAGSTIALGLRDAGGSAIAAYDIAADSSSLIQSRAEQLDVELVSSPAELAAAAEVIFSAVVCKQTGVAARQVAPHLTSNHWLLDINSVSPGVKAEAAEIVMGRHAHYVDVAVMSNVSVGLTRLPLLGAGRDADAVPALLAGVPIKYEVVSATPGDAARIKMFRSLFVKGLEALALESMLGTYASGTHQRVLDSLDATFAKYSFSELIRHLIGRHAVHGRRRADELEEVANTLSEVGVEPIMARAGFSRLSWDVDRGLQNRFDQDADPDWLSVLAALDELRRAEASDE
jgi:3-hydroxyisobutyrate dehydrogenase